MRIFITMFVVAIAVMALSRQAGANPADDKTQIEALVQTIVNGFIERDNAKVMTAYAPGDELVVFDLSPPLKHVGWQTVKDLNDKWFNAFKGKIEGNYSDLQLTVVGDVAYGSNIQHWKFTRTDGTSFEFNQRVMDVYRKINGRWYVVMEHASVPVDFDAGKPVLDAK